ncbi:chromosome segregation protein ScpA [Methyloceanibacter marginalis]|uniref:Segregation and condensation protein A n=1 Tax=Methyloceanibacter marginalis TaxID=1774971 RepID=A0A1E3WAL4_9HYPH|nr:ScpA family protein [Methyloceanibacter marginalis]ODS02849.1 chromosome segregation protein ScpA [Methyloceanibacter marginalis]
MSDEDSEDIKADEAPREPDSWGHEDERDPADPQLRVDVGGFEGPLDLLLALARTQKVDITKISVLALAQQYLDFIAEARALRLEIAADYLVMAAWLAFLKSKLLLPAEPPRRASRAAEELAALLAFRLKRLDAMRDAAARLMTRKRLGRDVFGRGCPEPIRVNRTSVYEANVYDLLKAYSQQRQRNATRTLHMEKRTVWSLKEARDELERLLGMACDWAPLDQLLAEFLVEPEMRRTALASSFTATLEMTREGALELRQAKSFAPLMVRRRGEAA